jgi:hypothetical protein
MISIGIGIPFGRRGGIVQSFKSRVAADSGTFEAEACLNQTVASLRALGLYDQSSLILTPNAYKAGKMYALKPTSGAGDLTFARAGIRQRFNSAGAFEDIAANVPALNYLFDASCPHWNFNRQATNGILNSFSLSGYSESGFTRLANILTETATSSIHTFSTPFQSGFTPNTLHCFSFIVQKISGPNRWVSMNVSNAVDGEIRSRIFNLQTGAITDSSSRTGSWSASGFEDGIIDLKNGYWLIYMVGQSSVGTSTRIQLGFRNNSAGAEYSQVYLGSTDFSVFVIGFQREVGIFPSYRIKTEGSAITRVVEQSITNNLESLIGQTQGTIAFKFAAYQRGTVFSIANSAGLIDNSINIFSVGTNGSVEFGVRKNNVSRAIVFVASSLADRLGTVVIRYTQTSVTIWYKGVVIYNVTHASADFLATLSRIAMGSVTEQAIVDFYPSPIFNTALSDAECLALSNL